MTNHDTPTTPKRWSPNTNVVIIVAIIAMAAIGFANSRDDAPPPVGTVPAATATVQEPPEPRENPPVMDRAEQERIAKIVAEATWANETLETRNHLCIGYLVLERDEVLMHLQSGMGPDGEGVSNLQLATAVYDMLEENC
jgi:hypothetical protein